ncbi:hypothetical protein EJB05_32813, partial [Eragrostis curvula]
MAGHMGPMANEEWSPSDIAVMKSLIVKHNNIINDCDSNAMNNKQRDILDVLQTQFPLKEKHQVIDLYLDIVVEIMQCQENSGTRPNAEGINLVNDNFGISVEDLAMDNMKMMHDSSLTTGDTRDRKVAQKAPRLFLHGLCVYGRGDWKNISRHIVKTRTPRQVSSHAQKYFRRLEGTTARQRYSINDVGLYDAEPWMMHSSLGGEVLTFSSGGSNLNDYITHDQASTPPAMSTLDQAWTPIQPAIQYNGG